MERRGPYAERNGRGGSGNGDRSGDRDGERPARSKLHDVLSLGARGVEDAPAQLGGRRRPFDRERERARRVAQARQVGAAALALDEMLLELRTLLRGEHVERVEG